MCCLYPGCVRNLQTLKCWQLYTEATYGLLHVYRRLVSVHRITGAEILVSHNKTKSTIFT